MSDTVSMDKAIAALSEINKLRHELNEEITRKERIYSERPWPSKDIQFCDGLRSSHKRLTAAIERAYEILNGQEE